jgi:uncharacterized protein YydD (DUF2326 family)
MQARIDELSAAHASTLHALNERLDGASQSYVQLKEQVRSGQGELAEIEARARELHRDLQVNCY